MHPVPFAVLGAFVTGVAAVNFPFEEIQLTEEDIADFEAIAFGDPKDPVVSDAECKAFPGTDDWPSDDAWTQFNSSLGGALLKPAPAASACYPGDFEDRTQCRYLLTKIEDSRFYLDDPLTVLTQWPQGNTCPLELNPRGECTQGGFPEYVVNVTTVAQIQMAVNFARNNNLRLVIKNTGHDFVGRSTGAGSLSIWTHFLKQFEFLPEYSVGEYSGMAARVGSGLEAWEMYDYMKAHDMSIVVPAGYTVGPFGGWMAGGGHSNLASLWGLGSDQVLSLEVVTADGKFVTADPEQNTDLFYALRGGGPGTYGIVTSAIVKAHPPINIVTSPFNFTTTNLEDIEVFWDAVDAFFWYSLYATDEFASTYSYVSPNGDDSYTFTGDIEMPGVTAEDAYAFLQPLYDYINDVGIETVQPQPVASERWSAMDRGVGDEPGNQRFATRLFPRENWDDEELFDETMAVMREIVEAGYVFHGINVSPSDEVAGWPGTDSGVNPAWRTAVMHADVFDAVPDKAPIQVIKDAHVKLDSYMDKLRALTPGSGAYVNEADVLEPDFQHSFWGDKYEKLLAIKKERDPWGVFWAAATVGSDSWVVKGSNGLPNQNGKLCKA